MKRCKEAPDYYRYHSYNGISERGQMFGAHFDFDAVTSEYYLGATMEDLHYNEVIRDKYTPGAEMWVTESADAACGGNTWGPTFVETIRYVDELARFNVNTRGIIFHNTLASSAYSCSCSGMCTVHIKRGFASQPGNQIKWQCDRRRRG